MEEVVISKKSLYQVATRKSIIRKVSLFKARHRIAVLTTLALCAVFSFGVVYRSLMPPRIDPTAYTTLLDTIAKGESSGNYNAYFGNASNTAVQFTDMPVRDVLAWQNEFIGRGNPSNAVGKYQFMEPTLRGLIQELGIDPSAKFDKSLQDRLAVALLERRGAVDYVQNKLTRQEFAANLAKEWAALPKATGVNPDQSYYAGDGLNEVRISLTEIYQAIDKMSS